MKKEHGGPENQRQHTRYPLSATAWISTEETGNAAPIEVLVANISLGGLGVYSPDTIKPGKALSVKIEFLAANGLLQEDKVRGRAVHCSRRGKLYFVGISFAELMNPIAQPALYDHFSRIISWD